MARISSTNIAFIPTEESNEVKSWKKARQEYIIKFGKFLLNCNEAEIIQIFDDWERSISELESIDKNQNYMTTLLTISILHYFNRSYDQIKEHIPFVMEMLQHKSRTLNKISSLVFKYLAIELTDNIEFLRDLMINYVQSWIESIQTRYSGMLILKVASKFYFSSILRPNVFAITTSQFDNLWKSAISDDVSMRIIACKCIDAHFSCLPLVSNKKEREDVVISIFSRCIDQIKLRQASSHGAVLICQSIIKYSLFHFIDITSLNTALLEVVTVKNDLLVYSSFSLLLDILQKAPHLFNSDFMNSLFVSLVNSIQKFITYSKLYYLLDDFIKYSNPIMVPINYIVNFFKAIMKYPRYKIQQQICFSILKTIFTLFKEATVPISFFTDAEPSPQYFEALKLRPSLINDVKSTLYKHFSEGLGPKATKNQVLLSLYILKDFGHYLFNNSIDNLYHQVVEFAGSRYVEVRCFISEILPLFQAQSSLDELLVLALFDESKKVRLSATRQLRFPDKFAHNEILTQILDDPSFKVKREAIPIVSEIVPLNPLLLIDPISLFIQKTIRSMMSSSDPQECARLSSLIPLIAEHFIPLCEGYIPQLIKLCFEYLNQRKEGVFETIDKIPSFDLSHDNYPLILNKNKFDKNCTNMRRIFQIEAQEWIDIRDCNLILTLQKIVNYLPPYIDEIVQLFINIFSLSNTSDFVLSSMLDSFIEIVQKLTVASDIPTTYPNLVIELMNLLRNKSPKIVENILTDNKLNDYDLTKYRKILTSNSSIYSNKNHSKSNSIAVKVLILMGKLGVNSFPTSRLEKSKINDPISDFNFRSSSFYTEFTISELLKLLKESNSTIYEVITAIFIKESEIASKFLERIVTSFCNSLAINKGIQRDILFNQLEIISYFAADKMTPYTNILLPHIIKNINSMSALKVAIVLSYFLKTELIPTVQPLFQIALHFLHKVFTYKSMPVISKPQQIVKASSKSHFSLSNLKSLLTSNSTKDEENNPNFNDNSTYYLGTKYQISSVTNDSLNYIEVLLKFLAGAIIFQNQPIGLFVAECERIINFLLPKNNNLALSTSLIERLSLVLHSLIMIVQLADASFECSNITRICIRLLNTPLNNLVFQLLFSLSIYCHLSPDVIDFLAAEENMSNHMVQTLRDYLKDRMIPLSTFLLKEDFSVSVKIPEKMELLAKRQRRNVLLPQPFQHHSSTNSSSNDSKKISTSSSSSNYINSNNNEVYSSYVSDSFPKSSSTMVMNTKNVPNGGCGIELSKSYNSLYFSFVFKDCPPPQFRNIEKWLEDLCNAVVADSPSVAIRSCSKIVQHSPAFRKVIFPIAFLSCWRITQMNDRMEFSKAIQTIFETENKVTNVFLNLAELLLRVGHPLIISNFVIAKSCQSPAMALRFLVRHLKENPTDNDAMELILTLNMRLGRIDSSAGILKTVKLPTAGTWYEKIGDWKSALKFYMKKHQQNHKNHHSNDIDHCTSNCDFNSNEVGPILRCCANLEQWDEIRKLSRLFDSMNEEEKVKNSVWFAWAFYKINDLYKVYLYVKKLEDSDDLNMMLFEVIFFVASDQYDKAKSTLYKMMQILISDCSVYSALNASQADENLTYANYMVEIQEVLEYKSLKEKTISSDSNSDLVDLNEKMKEIVKGWRRRLEYHNGDALSWLRLVEICNLAVRINENQKTYVKLMTVLLKKRRFEIIHAYWNEMLQVMHDPSVQILYHKIQWELGKKRQCIQSLNLLKLMYESTNMTEEGFRNELDKVPQYVKDTFYKDIIKPISSTENQNHITNFENGSFDEFFKFGEVLRAKSKITQKEKGRFFRIEAAFRAQLYQKSESFSNLVKTIDLYKKACELTPDDYRAWAGFAYSAARAIGSSGDRLKETFVLQAMNGFLKATQLLQPNNLVYLLQLFSLFFRYGGKVTSLGIPDEIVNLRPDIINQILPQIVCQINHSEPSVRKIVHEIIIRFSKNHFQALVFSLHVLITSEDKEKSSIAAQLLEELSYKHSQLAKEAKMLVDGLMRAAVTWYEMWMARLDAAYLVWTKNNNINLGVKMLEQLFETVKRPRCKLDQQFIEKTKNAISTCAASINQFTPYQTSFQNLWFQIRRLYPFLRDKFKQIESIELDEVSEDLFNYRNFLLSIPGTYKVTADNESNKETRIFKLNPELPILTTQQNPRLLFMTDMSGKEWKFLLKGNEDLRLDQRIMQFFDLINILIKTHKATSNLGLAILKYPIIPFAQNAGLISWVVGADTLHQLVNDYRKSRMISLWAENEWIFKFAIPQQFDLLLSAQKCEIWDNVSANFPADELYETFWEKTPDAVSWVHCVDTFALTTALMSMAGYIIGLGDRHPSNILIQRQTGHVIHIDFGDSFEISLNRDKMPEKVPFRLTRMIINAFGVSGVEGTFRNACVNIMRVLRENKSPIIAQLEIFVHEPIFQNKENESSSEGKNRVLDRIIQKLNGKDPVDDIFIPSLSRSNSPSRSNSISRRSSINDNKENVLISHDEEEIRDDDNENDSVIIDEEEGRNETDNDELNVEEQVDRLIKIASDPYRYVQHYLGWCQFW